MASSSSSTLCGRYMGSTSIAQSMAARSFCEYPFLNASTAGFIVSFTGGHHFVLDYLVEEVLEQQSKDVQAFLLRTSICDRLCGPLCDTVLEAPSPSGQEILEYLERNNLFIIPHHVVPGGMVGVAQLVNHLTGWPIGLMALAINIPILAVDLYITIFFLKRPGPSFFPLHVSVVIIEAKRFAGQIFSVSPAAIGTKSRRATS